MRQLVMMDRSVTCKFDTLLAEVTTAEPHKIPGVIAGCVDKNGIYFLLRQ